MADDAVNETQSESSDDELLSDEEKDALLAGVATGTIGEASADADAAHVRPFEIRPDAYINYGSYPRLQLICQELAKRLETSWSQLFRNEMHVYAEDAFASTFGAATRHLLAPVITTTIEMQPLPRHALLIVDNVLLAGIVDAFFGVPKPPADAELAADEPTPERLQFTPGELRVSEIACERFVEVIAPAWERLVALQPRATGRELDPSVGCGVASNETVIVCRFVVQTPTSDGCLHWLLPHAQIASLADELEGARNARSAAGDPHWRQCMTARLADTTLDCDVRVGDLRLPLRRIVELQPGDVLPLESPEYARLHVAGTLRAAGRFGTSDARNAFSLSAWLPEAGDE